MLTDIFCQRYWENAEIRAIEWETCHRFFNQCVQIVEDDLIARLPGDHLESVWTDAYRKTIRELGLANLGGGLPETFRWRCRALISGQNGVEEFYRDNAVHMLSFTLLELALAEAERRFQMHIATISARRQVAHLAATSFADRITVSQLEHQIASATNHLQACQDEMNHRLQAANIPLRYHTGKLQISTDNRLAEEIERPFWAALADSAWRNAVTEFQEAIDRRDNNRADPTPHALMGLESIVKIICDRENRLTGRERGFAHYVDDLVRVDNGQRFIEVWEKDALVALNNTARNALVHGAGAGEPERRTPQQAAHLIREAMSWAISLTTR